ncbi:MAG: outer membrane beta-barrel protein [Flavobacteriales bacterium]|nr:outer membrane beta-barrel protein [Flavobacteriales bacterium]
MKKAILIAAAALFMVCGVQAQKQTGGENNLEVQFTPLGGSPISINGLRFRRFTSETTALRVNLFVGASTDRSVTAQEGEFSPEDPVSPVLYMYDRTFDLTIRPGYEIHFDGTDRLSPYVGAEIDFGIGSMSTEEEFWSADDEDNVGDLDQFVTWSSTTKDGYVRFGLNLIAGFDFYFADNIYLGGELGFGFANTSMRDTEIETDNQNAWGLANAGDEGADLPDPTENGSMFNVGPTVNAAIRLGFLFN